MNSFSLYIIFLLYFFTQGNATNSTSGDKLLFVQVLSRHGARHAFGQYWNWKDSSQSIGELTPAGYRQQYNLGRQFKKDYIEKIHFLNEEFNHNEIYVRSSDTNRTIQSAQCQLKGMFPKGKKIPKGLNSTYLLPPFEGVEDSLELGEYSLPYNSHVFPVHSVPADNDALLRPWKLCPQSKIKQNEFLKANDRIVKFIDKHYQSLYKKLSQVLQEEIYTYSQIGGFNDGLQDVLTCNLYNQQSVPEQITEEDLEEINFINTFSWIFADFGSSEVIKALSSPYLTSLFNTLDSKLKGENPLKLVMHSAHDINLILSMRILNITSPSCIMEKKFKGKTSSQCEYHPPFSSSLIWELYENEENQEKVNFMKVKYNGRYINLCSTNSTKCEYNKLKELIKNSIYLDFEQSCANFSDQPQEI